MKDNNTKLKMFKAQLLVLLLMFYVQKSVCDLSLRDLVSSEAGLHKVKYSFEAKGRYKRFAGSEIPTALGAADIRVESSSVSEIKITSTYSNDSVKLTCAAIGEDISYLWTAKRENLLENEVAEGNILSINKVTKKNDRKFCCEAFNEESIEKCIRLPPRVLTSSSLELPVGSPAAMLCETIGTDASKLYINWKRADGAPLPGNAMVDGGLLKIPELARADAGIYVCVGSSNGQDEAFHSELSLKVIFPPEIEDLIITGLDGNLDNNVTIQCITQCDETMTYEWRAHTEGSTDLRKNEQARGNIFSIYNFEKDNEGTFCCVATNALDNREKCLTIKPIALEVHPKESHEVILGSSVTLECQESETDPNVKIVWARNDGQPLARNVDQLANGSLTITDITINEEGRYDCSATKGVLSASATVEIKVKPLPVVQITPSNDGRIIAKLGDELKLTCNGAGHPKPNVQWYKFSNDSNAYEVVATIESAVYEIGSLSEKEAGLYFCLAENSAGSSNKAVQVVIKPPALKVHPAISQTVMPGSSVTLRCHESAGYENIEIHWTREDGNPFASNVVPSANGALTITNIAISEEGSYKCFAKNEITSASVTTEIKVETLPVVEIRPSNDGNIIVKLGDAVKLECNADGHPRPSVQWQKFSNERNSYENVASPESSIYEITASSQNEAGLYLCLAKNSAGSSNKVVQIVIKPPALKVHPAVSQTVISGSSVILECHESAGYENIEIHWTREDGNSFTSNVVPSANGILTITNIAISEEGSYKCSAKNEVASASVTTEIKVGTLPEVQIIPGANGNIIEKLGDKVKLTCTAYGHPQPNVQWQKLSPEAESYRPLTPITPNSASYEIRSLSENEAGLYLCLAQNSAGSSNKTVQVVIKSLDFQVHPSTSQAVMSGSSVTLECRESAGYENIEIHWAREDGRPFAPNFVSSADGSLTITNVAISEEGRYKCSATKGVLLASATAEIEVTTLPVVEIIPSNDGHITGKVGDKVDLICQAEGHPQPSIEWQKFSTETHSYQTIKSATPEFAVHGILVLSANEAERYQCLATNSVGSSHKTVDLKIEQPVLGAYLKVRPQTVPPGSSVTLECREYAGFSNMKYEWAREDGHEFASNVVQLADGALEIVDITINERGRYKCSATNGKASAFATVDIEVDTPISNIEIEVQFPGVSLVALNCQAIGGRASYRWTAENGDLPENVIVEGNQLSVDSYSPEAKNNRKYCCEAFNTAGYYKKCEQFPHMSVYFTEMTRRVGDSVEMGCPIIGVEYSQLDIKWERTDGSPLPENAIVVDDRITIPELGERDAGTYACVGTYTVDGAPYVLNNKTPLTVNSF